MLGSRSLRLSIAVCQYVCGCMCVWGGSRSPGLTTVYMQVCVSACSHVCVCACMRVCGCMYMWVYAGVCGCMHVCMRVRVCMCVCGGRGSAAARGSPLPAHPSSKLMLELEPLGLG